MGVSTTEPVGLKLPASPQPKTPPWRRPELFVAIAAAAIALELAVSTHARHAAALPHLARGMVVTLVLFAVCGYAAAYVLVPRAWGALAPLLVVPVGAVTSALALTVLGLAHVPLAAGIAIVLVLGAGAALLVRGRGSLRREPLSIDRVQLSSWVAVLFVLLCVGLIPAWRTSADTIFGQNPDSHQVVGVAVLFQHVPPTGRDNALPIDTVPPAWRFRYPIFYGLAAVSKLAHLDPIQVFPAIAALLLVIAALGCGALVMRLFALPASAGMMAAAAVGVSWVALYLAWHPYWNQLWGLALLPYGVLFGWHAIASRDARAGALAVVMLVMLWLAYPLALPYPLLLLAGLWIAHAGRPHMPRLRARGAGIAALAVLVLLPAAAGAALKLEQGFAQLLSPSAAWQGDVLHFLPVGRFVGTGGGVLPALAVLALAVYAAAMLPGRMRLALLAAFAIFCLVDVRLRLSSAGTYIDFKHLSFVGTLVLSGAAAGAWRLLSARSVVLVAIAALLIGAWAGAALIQDHRLVNATAEQVTPEILQIRSWASALPRGASVRVDIPPSGVQLWAVYMLGDHPVDTPTPVLQPTYAYAHPGLRAQYALSLRRYPGSLRPYPPRLYAQNPPLFQNDQFVLRRVAWPASKASFPDTSSTELVEP